MLANSPGAVTMTADPTYVENMQGAQADRIVLPDVASIFATDGVSNLIMLRALALSAQHTVKLVSGNFITDDSDDSKIAELIVPCEAELTNGDRVVIVAIRMELDSTDGSVQSVTSECLRKPLSVAPTEEEVTYVKMVDVKGWFATSALPAPDIAAINKYFASSRDFGKGPWRFNSIENVCAFLSPKGPDYLTKVTRTLDDLEAKEIAALKIQYKGDAKGLNAARGEMIKLVEPLRGALESKSPYLGAAIHERVIFINKVAMSEHTEAELTKVLEQQIMYARFCCLASGPAPSRARPSQFSLLGANFHSL